MSLVDRSFNWLHRALLERPTQTGQLMRPNVVMPCVDILGTEKLQEADHVGATGIVDATTVQLAVVPDQEVWYVLAAFLTVTAAANDPRIVLRDRNGQEVAISTLSTTAFRVFAADRPFYVPPTFQVGGTVASLPAGAQLTIRVVRVALELGEYLRGA